MITKHFWEQWNMIVDSRVIVIRTNIGHSLSPVYTVNYNYDEPFKKRSFQKCRVYKGSSFTVCYIGTE